MSGDDAEPDLIAKAQKFFKLRAKQIGDIEWSGGLVALAGTSPDDSIPLCEAVAPDASEKGTLTLAPVARRPPWAKERRTK